MRLRDYIANPDDLARVEAELSVVGINNTVTYRDGEPKINDTGSNNSITKG